MSITVLIPCYNSAKYLEKTLQAAMAQTYEALQILCADDGSTDETAAIIHQWQKAVTKKLTPRLLNAFAMQGLIKRMLLQLNIYPEHRERFEPWPAHNFRRAVALSREPENEVQPTGPAEKTKLRVLQEVIDFPFVSRKFPFFKKFKYRFLFSRSDWHLAYLRYKFRKL